MDSFLGSEGWERKASFPDILSLSYSNRHSFNSFLIVFSYLVALANTAHKTVVEAGASVLFLTSVGTPYNSALMKMLAFNW